MDPMTMMLISGFADAGVSAYRNIKAKKGLAELEKQRLPQYMDAAAGLQENKKMYGDMAKSGMGPGSLNLAKSTFAAGQSALTAAPAGGQLRTQIGRLAGANAGGFANSLAAQNEGIRRQGMSGVAQANLGLSELQQRDIGVGLQRRFKAEEDYGQAIQDSRRQFMGAVTGGASGYMDYKNLQEDRALARDMYVPKQQTPGGFNPNLLVGPPGQFPLPGSMMNGPLPQSPTPSMSLADRGSLPASMGGFGGDRTSLTAGLPVNKANLPFNMGGTGGLRENYAPFESDISLTSNLPYYMGGMGGLNRIPTAGFKNTYGAETGPFGQIMFKPNK